MTDTDTDRLLKWAAGYDTPTTLREQVREALEADDPAADQIVDITHIGLGKVLSHVREQVPEVVNHDVRVTLRQPDKVLARWPDLPGRVADAVTAALAELAANGEAIRAEWADEEAKVQARVARAHAEEQRRQQIEFAAERVHEGKRALDTQRLRWEMEVGRLATIVQDDAKAASAEGRTPPVDLTWLASRAGLSRPTLYKYADRVRSAARGDVRQLTNEELAEMHLGYGPGCDDEVDAEMWRRYPALAGWWRATEWLREEEEGAHRPDYDPWEQRQWTGPPRTSPAVSALYSRYLAFVKEIAAGPL